MFLDALTDTFIDGIKILPFLFVTYVLMEYIEHKAGSKAERFVKKSGRLGPVVGSILGVVPQCGFSAAAANFYAGRIITLGTFLIAIVGEDKLGSFMTSVPALGILLSGLIGLIPNCAASVVITQLYLEGLLTMGSMMAGLLVGSGIGLLVLFRVNEDMKENLKITTMLYVIGIACGFLIDLIL